MNISSSYSKLHTKEMEKTNMHPSIQDKGAWNNTEQKRGNP
jgi:hypothetical protein